MKQKPKSCTGCPLEHSGTGWADPDGPPTALIALVGEALGWQEAEQGIPFVGQAGAYLNRAIGLLGGERKDYRIGNVLSCQPPKDWLVGAPWEQGAIQHCHSHRYLNLYANEPKVYVTLGVTATKTVLRELHNITYSGELNNWQGRACGSHFPYVIPTYHPAFLIRGNQRLLGTVCFALQRASEIAAFGPPSLLEGLDGVSLIVDPDPEWFAQWADTLSDEAWLAVDIETDMKPTDEDDLVVAGAITRINFSHNPAQGVTVPWDPRYHFGIRRLLSSPNPKVYWNARFDIPILVWAGFTPSGAVLDGMWAWHVLQSDLPRGLGFVSAFYSQLPPWKHLSQENPGYYAAMDTVQTLRCMFGIAKDLKSSGQWEVFLNHVTKLDSRVIHPMEDVGLKLDPTRLREFHVELDGRLKELSQKIQSTVPAEVRPWVGGWKTQQPGSTPRTVKKLVPCCTDCGETDVTLKHRCKETA